MDAQMIANQLGQTQRDLESALATGDISSARTLASQQHDNLATAFAVARDQHGIELDWGAAAGTVTNAQARGGGSKDAPATVDQA